jgi:DNA processing protein
MPPEWAYAAALAGLPYMAWDRLAAMVADCGPRQAWERVRSGEVGPAWARAARSTSVEQVASDHVGAGVSALVRGEKGYPGPLAADPEAPPVLFSRGALETLERPRVGIVGTRRCSGYGTDVARHLGRQLAAAGVAVVSGLALGIDGAAHEGALAGGGAAPVGVVANGLDVAYPRRHARLIGRVAGSGVLLSEAPVGCRPEAWRFPARNRLIASLSQVLVVVESHRTGGSFHTVRAAAERGVVVMAVPGPIWSPSSAGTNQLLSEGCPPVCDADDVLVALSLDTAGHAPSPSLRLPPGEGRPVPTGEAAAVLDVLDWQPSSPDRLLARTGLPPARLAVLLAGLERDGWARPRGGWWERVPPPTAGNVRGAS